MPTIEVRRCQDNPEVAMRRLKRTCDRNGLQKFVRAQEHFVSDSEKKRKDKTAAIKRAQKKARESGQRSQLKHRQRSWRVPLESVADVENKDNDSNQ